MIEVTSKDIGRRVRLAQYDIAGVGEIIDSISCGKCIHGRHCVQVKWAKFTCHCDERKLKWADGDLL